MKKTAALVFGRFNLIHAGHFRLFHFARTFCDTLYVGLLTDDKARGLRPFKDRVRDLSAISLIDQVIPYTNVLTLVKDVSPEVVIRGHEFKSAVDHEAEALDRSGVKVVFMSADERYDMKVVYAETDSKEGAYEENFRRRYNVNPDSITAALSRTSPLKGAVIGEIIVDEYVDATPIGMSQEDKNIVYSIGHSSCHLGGAGIVAAHCAGLGASIEFISTVGDDDDHQFALSRLEAFGVRSTLIVEKARRSIRKTRFLWDDRAIFRASLIDSHLIDDASQQQMAAAFSQSSKELDFLILSDFNYGILPNELVYELKQIARENEMFIAADCQISSQTGDWKKYSGVDLICPTEYEARVALRDFDSGVAYLGQKLRDELEVENLILTLGKSGLLIFCGDGAQFSVEKLEPYASRVVDASGAGDSLLASASYLMAAGLDVYTAAYVGSIAAGLQLSQRGNSPLEHEFWKGVFSGVESSS